MARTAHKPKKAKRKRSRRSWAGVARPAARCILLIAVIAAACVGLARMDHWVHGRPAFAAPARVMLVNAPDDLVDAIRTTLSPFEHHPWSRAGLCREISDALESDPWVERVLSVRRFGDGRIDVRCRYRTPVAMVQTPDGFLLVDGAGVRLPGVYEYDAAYMLIQGVTTPPPAPGEVWDTGQVCCGVQLVRLLDGEAFADQITAVLVHNYKGRQDRSAPQLELATTRPGGRIIWGSPIGEEIEENSAAEKLELLRANYARFGRADANRRVIDVSVLPDRTYIPT